MDQNLNPEQEAKQAVEVVMPKQKQPGRMALQIFAIVVLLGLVGYGVYAWQNNRVAQLSRQVDDLQKQAAEVKDTKVDPYANWKSYTTKYEKVTFKYPASLTLKDESYVNKDQGLSPGVDIVTLTGASGLRLKIWNGASGIGGACPECKFPRTDAITFLGNINYLSYVDPGTGLIQSVELGTSRDSFISGLYPSKNITIVDTKLPTANLYSISYAKTDGSATPKPLATFVNDPAMADLKLVLESFSY